VLQTALMSIVRLKTSFLLSHSSGESCCRPQASDKADTGEDFYSFSMHDSDSQVADSGCKVETPVFEWSITWTWAAEEVSECLSSTTPVFHHQLL